MEALFNVHFLRPAWLLLALPAIVLWWRWQRRSDPLRGWREQMAPEFLEVLVVGGTSARSRSGWWLLAGWLLAIVAIAGPTGRLTPSPFADDATPLMVLLKADVSMETADLTPSRLERARLKIADLAEARAGQPLGLIAYAGTAHLVLPPTRDTEVVASMASEISPDIMPVSGDRLELALREADRVLGGGLDGGHVVVLADSVNADPGLLQSLRGELASPVQFLAVTPPNSPQEASVRAAAGALRAKAVTMDVEGRDIAAIVRRAASAPVAQAGEQGGQWQEAGYWLVPVLGAMVLLSVRRKAYDEGHEPEGPATA